MTVRYEWLDDYLMAKPKVTKDLQPDWNWIRYHIGGKMFAAVLLDDQNEPCYINVKLDPLEGELLRGQYPDIIPGYYSDKRCWNSVKPDGDVPDALLRTMLDKSYHLVLQGFSKKRQREILGISCCGADCSACALYGDKCEGCNALNGRVFHAPQGKACPIYACCTKRRCVSCADCSDMPCAIWRATRDPGLTDAAFEAGILERAARLRNVRGK